MQSKRHWASLVLVATLASAPASAAVISVTNSVSGAPGAWVHEFTVFNNLPNTNNIYFFGVSLDTGRNVVGSPDDYNPNAHLSWSNAGFGASDTVYNNVWIDSSFANLLPGTSLGGFKALDTGETASMGIRYFVFAYRGNYTGPECFYCGDNPGFEGIVGDRSGAVPEPAAWALMITGFGLVGAAARRQPKQVAS